MATIICQHCGKVKEVRGTSGDTSPLPEALAVKEWCQCAKIPDWWSFTFSPPEILTQKDAEIARLTAELAQARAERDRAYNDNERTRYDIWALANEYGTSIEHVYSKDVEENIRGLLRTSDRPPLVERQRRTIRALVVSNRAMWWVMDRIASAHQVVHLVNLTRTAISVEAKHIGQQAGE